MVFYMISVIIPAYNVEKYIARCLDSICEQKYHDLEIIVIDDGSDDKTPEICDQYAEKDRRIKVVHKANEGVSAARNTALNIASGDSIAFCDADDYFEPDMLERMHEAMERSSADMVSCGYYEEYEDRVDNYGLGSDESELVLNKYAAYVDYLRMGGRLGSGCWNKLIKKKAIDEIRFKPYKLGEDVEFLSRVLDNCTTVVCIGYRGYHYIHRKGSATRLTFSKTNMDILHVSDEMVEYFKRNHPELLRRAYAFHAAWHSAQIQVMHWQKDTSAFKNEKEYIKRSVRANRKGYAFNTYISLADRLFINSFMVGMYKPAKGIYDAVSKLRKQGYNKET